MYITVIFDRHAKLPIDAGSVPFSTGTTISPQRLPVTPGRSQGSAEHPTVTLTSVRAMGSVILALSAQVLPVQLAAQLHRHGPTAIDETSPAIKRPKRSGVRAPGGTIECASERGRQGPGRMGRARRGLL